MRYYLSLLLLLIGSTTYAQTLEGPKVGTVGVPVVVKVLGLPKLDLDKPVKENLKWRDSLSLTLNAPGDPAETPKLKSNIGIDYLDSSFDVSISFVPIKPGTYILISDWNEDPYQLHTLRIEISGNNPDINPPVPDVVPPDPNPKIKLPGTTKRLMIITDLDNLYALPNKQKDVIISTRVRQIYEDKLPKYNNQANFRIYDDDLTVDRIIATVENNENTKEWVEWFKIAKEESKKNNNKLPWLLYSNGKDIQVSMPLPEDVDKMVDWCTKNL